jgi:atlastin
MPHPGLKVATNPAFDGRLSDIEQDFRNQLAELVPLVLSPKNLVVKRIGGNKVKAKELLHYFKAYTAIYKGNELPEPKSMLEATAEANNLSAVASAKDLYSGAMEEICGGNKPFMSTARIEEEHGRVKDKAMQLFQSKRKMGGDDFSHKYRDTLEKVGAMI